KDSKGRYWSGTASGLYNLKFDLYNNLTSYKLVKYKDYKPDEDDPVVYNIYEDSKGRFWIATREGLSLYNASTGQYRFFQHDSSPNSLSNNVTRYIHEDDIGRIWVASGNGLNLVEENNNDIKFKVFKGNSAHPTLLDNII